MKKRATKVSVSTFDKIRKSDDSNNEYWSANELGKLLGYIDDGSFLQVLDKAKTACINSGQKLQDHFRDVHEKEPGNIEFNESKDIHLSRYGCYLAIQNADPNLKPVAIGQTYLAINARLSELDGQEKRNSLKVLKERRIFLRNELAQRNVQLSGAAQKAGIVKPRDYALFQNHGYRGLYGGLDVKGIRTAKQLKEDQNILDYMDSTELAANLFRVIQTTEKLNNDKVVNPVDANSIHFAVGLKVRKAIEDTGNTLPENLPLAESIKLERQDKRNNSQKIKTNKPTSSKNKRS